MESTGRVWIGRLALVGFFLLWAGPAFPHEERDAITPPSHESSPPHHAGADHTDPWEGSAEGKAYSNFNHHLAGMFVILIGLSEVRYGFTPSVLAWTRLLLPIFMVSVGVFLLIWSDHKGWPLGSFSRTFLSGEWEIIQHKWFGIMAVTIGGIEWLRRTGHLAGRVWKVP